MNNISLGQKGVRKKVKLSTSFVAADFETDLFC